jgi:hypothetical protein
MLKGTYVFKQDGIEIGRSENIVTTNGKTAILQYLCGSVSEWASSIAVGAMASPVSPATTAPALTDLTLAYEIARSAVTLKSFQVGSPNLLIVKGTLDASVSANIYEVGVFPITTSSIFGTRDTLILDDFSATANWTPSSNYTVNAYAAQNSLSPRIGLNSLNLSANTTTTNTSFFTSLSSYSNLDSLNVLANVGSASQGTLNVILKDSNGVSVTIPYTFNGSVSSGYQILTANLPSNIGSLATINSIALQTVGSSSSITVDAIRVSVLGEVTNSAGLISRSVLTTPIAKIYGIPLDIEYYLQLG